jgi:hypothetical protein
MSTGLYTQPQGSNPQYPSPQYPSPQYPGLQPAYGDPPRTSGGGSNWIMSLLLIGGGVLLIGSVLFVAAIWWAVSSLEGMMVGLGREGMVAIVEESDIPPGEKKEVVAQIDRVAAAYKAGEIGQEDLDRLFTGLDDSPVMTYISFYGLHDYYLEDTSLSQDEQDELKRAWRRGVHGMFTGKISSDDFYDALPFDDHFEVARANSDNEANALMRKWLARMTRLADEAGVPADPPEVDIGDEAKKLVDTLLAK